jgi:hypothetical protein
MDPYTNHYVNPLHVDDPERDPFYVPAHHLGPDSTASRRPAARPTVNKPIPFLGGVKKKPPIAGPNII